MICRHLAGLERALQEAGFRETARGQVWTKDCREWVYFDVVLDLPEIRRRFALDPRVQDHENLDPRSGTERGFWCSECHDGVMGLLSGPVRFP